MNHPPMLRPPFEWPIPTPELKNDRVVLRHVSLADVDEIFSNAIDPDTIKFTNVPIPYTRTHAEDFVKATKVRWAIEDTQEPGRMAGNLKFELADLRAYSIQVGYNTNPWARGKGLMTHALRLATTHVFNEGVERIVLYTRVDNVASRRVAEKAGFQFEGVARGAELHRDANRYDVAQYGLLATDIL